jgi:hypothetical protein
MYSPNPTLNTPRSQLDVIVGMLDRQFSKVESMLREATIGVTAFADFPVRHWKKICSTNPLERVNKEIKRRTESSVCSPTASLRPGVRSRLVGEPSGCARLSPLEPSLSDRVVVSLPCAITGDDPCPGQRAPRQDWFARPRTAGGGSHSKPD